MLVVLVFAVVMAGAYYWLVHRPLYEQLRGLDETEVRLLFRNQRNQLRLDFEGAQSELTSIAKRDVIRGFDPVQLDKALAQEEQTTTFYKRFTIMDMNSRVVSRPSIPSSNGLDRSDRGYFRGPLGNNSLYIEVEDDGVGFRPEPLPPRESQIGGLGLFSFRERVRQIGGSLSIESNPDRGCLVTVVIPLKAGSEVRREEIESR